MAHMSEQYGYETQLFETLETTHMEPLIRGVFDEIRVYNELLVNQPLNRDEINSIINELDTKWSTLIDSTAVFSGRASFPNPSHDNQFEEDYYDEETFTFGGVISHSDHERNLFIEENEPRYYDLRVHLEREVVGPDGEVARLVGGAKVDEVVALEIENIMSFERARYILEDNCPELLDDIDIALSADASDEGSAALGLAACSYDPIIHDEHTREQVKEALNCYTAALITFDARVGYHLAVDGHAWLMNEVTGVAQLAMLEGVSLAVVERILWCENPEKDVNNLVPSLASRLHREEINDTSDLLFIPFASIDALSSLRYQYYSQNK